MIHIPKAKDAAALPGPDEQVRQLGDVACYSPSLILSKHPRNIGSVLCLMRIDIRE